MENQVVEPFVEYMRLRERNELTLPKKVREFLGVDAGDYLCFERKHNNHITVTKAIPTSDLTKGEYQPTKWGKDGGDGEERTSNPIESGDEN